MTVTFRPLTRGDLAVVGQLVTSSFDDRLTPYMVATQHGWTDFIGVTLDHPAQFPAQHLHVGELEGQVVAFADFRAPGDGSGFLSYICVAPAARGQGIARQLLRACVRAAGDLRTVGLDVFEDNEPARGLYAALGFVDGVGPGDRLVWWRAPIRRESSPVPVTLTGLPAALAALDRYGFCELSGSRADRPFRCGRIGTSVLRLFSSEDFDDAALAASLAEELEDLSDIFGVLPAAHRPRAEGAEAFNRVVRMTHSDLPRLLGDP